MEDWLVMFKSNPVGAIILAAGTGGAFLWKYRQEKVTNNNDVLRIQATLEQALKDREAMRVERDEEKDRADAAFAKQLELTERFSEMRGQNERLLERMEQVSKQISTMAEDNASLRQQVSTLKEQNKTLSEQVNKLQQTIDSGVK